METTKKAESANQTHSPTGEMKCLPGGGDIVPVADLPTSLEAATVTRDLEQCTSDELVAMVLRSHRQARDDYAAAIQRRRMGAMGFWEVGLFLSVLRKRHSRNEGGDGRWREICRECGFSKTNANKAIAFQQRVGPNPGVLKQLGLTQTEAEVLFGVRNFLPPSSEAPTSQPEADRMGARAPGATILIAQSGNSLAKPVETGIDAPEFTAASPRPKTSVMRNRSVPLPSNGHQSSPVLGDPEITNTPHEQLVVVLNRAIGELPNCRTLPDYEEVLARITAAMNNFREDWREIIPPAANVHIVAVRVLLDEE